MARVKPTPEEFEVTENAVKHKPTGARWWWSYPGNQSDDVGQRAGSLGDVLPNGDDYDVWEVKKMALVLLATTKGQ